MNQPTIQKPKPDKVTSLFLKLIRSVVELFKSRAKSPEALSEAGWWEEAIRHRRQSKAHALKKRNEADPRSSAKSGAKPEAVVLLERMTPFVVLARAGAKSPEAADEADRLLKSIRIRVGELKGEKVSQ